MPGDRVRALRLTAILIGSFVLGCGFAPTTEFNEEQAEGDRFVSSRKVKRLTPRGDCIRWVAPPVRLSPEDAAESRHHPNVLRVEERILVGWQIGRSVASVATVATGMQLGNVTREHVLSKSTDARATHPELVSHNGVHRLVWTNDPTGAVRMQTVDEDGAAVGDILDIVPDEGRDGFYPDMAVAPDGRILVVWYAGHEEVAPAYSWAWVGDTVEGPFTVELDEKVKRGGPPTVFFDLDGKPWLVGSQVIPDGDWGLATIRLWPIEGDGLGESKLMVRAQQRFERPTVGLVPDGTLLLGWTRYAVANQPWGAFAQRIDADFKPVKKPRSLGRGPGRMVDLDVEGRIGLTAWEEPFEDDDVVMEVVDLEANKIMCGPVRVHILTAGHQTRANVDLWTDNDEVQGVIVWQSGETRIGPHEVWGRRFTIPDP